MSCIHLRQLTDTIDRPTFRDFRCVRCLAWYCLLWHFLNTCLFLLEYFLVLLSISSLGWTTCCPYLFWGRPCALFLVDDDKFYLNDKKVYFMVFVSLATKHFSCICPWWIMGSPWSPTSMSLDKLLRVPILDMATEEILFFNIGLHLCNMMGKSTICNWFSSSRSRSFGN